MAWGSHNSFHQAAANWALAWFAQTAYSSQAWAEVLELKNNVTQWEKEWAEIANTFGSEDKDDEQRIA